MKYVQQISSNVIGCYALFEIKQYTLPNGNSFENLLVVHEGNWTTPNGMCCHLEYEQYEDIQKALGKGLTFIKKEYSQLLNRSLFLYDFEYGAECTHILAVSATGEQIYFEIYGVDNFGSLGLLEHREL